jgi:hypothetical protein
MSHIARFNISEIMPERASILKAQGISEGKPVPEKINSLLEKAVETASTRVWPVGMISEVSIKEFEAIFRGEGQNEPETPLEGIFPKADQLSLFAVTLGSKISLEIDELFKSSDFALGTMLDTVASQAADKAVEVMEIRFLDDTKKKHINKNKKGIPSQDIYVLSYSPGYCGWHVSGQKKLFEYLKPDEIGISLNESFLMSPLKSVTGVLIAGSREIHFFEANYPFCKFCKHPTCLDRRKNILEAERN